MKNFVPLLDEHFENIKEFLKSREALDLFPKPKVIRHNDWLDIEKKVTEKYGKPHALFGKCFHSAKFVLFFGGGKRYLDLKLIKPFEFCDLGFKTTHWFCKSKETKKVYDPTSSQFIYPGYEPSDLSHLWDNAKNGDFGNPYFKKGGQRYEEVVPSKVVMDLGKLYKEQYGTNGGIDYWIKESSKNHIKQIDALEKFFA